MELGHQNVVTFTAGNVYLTVTLRISLWLQQNLLGKNNNSQIASRLGGLTETDIRPDYCKQMRNSD